MKQYKFNPDARELTSNEVAQMMFIFLSSITRPNSPVGENNVTIDESFYEKLPENLKEVFKCVKE